MLQHVNEPKVLRKPNLYYYIIFGNDKRIVHISKFVYFYTKINFWQDPSNIFAPHLSIAFPMNHALCKSSHYSHHKMCFCFCSYTQFTSVHFSIFELWENTLILHRFLKYLFSCTLRVQFWYQ